MDIDERQARWATEAAIAARNLSRVADLTTLIDPRPGAIDIGGINDWAKRLHAWSLEVAGAIDRPALTDDLHQRQQAFLDWRELHDRLQKKSRLKDS